MPRGVWEEQTEAGGGRKEWGRGGERISGRGNGHVLIKCGDGGWGKCKEHWGDYRIM